MKSIAQRVIQLVIGDKELVEFLVEEIAAEKKNSKPRNMANLDGFDVRLDGAQITLSKKFNDEM